MKAPLSVAVALVLLASLAACAPAPPRRLVVRAGYVVDGSDAPAQRDLRIVVEEGTITSVVPDDGAAPAARGADEVVIDARSATVMPGLIDMHVHLLSAGACDPTVGAGLATGLRSLHALLRSGVTTAADLAAPLPVAVGLRRYVGTARGRGPRLLVAGPLITRTGGYLTQVADGFMKESGVVVEVDSAAAARAEVRRLAEADVDLIKVGLQELDFNESPLPLLAGEVLCALVDEAHTQELRVLAHALTNRAFAAGLDCGVDGLVHGAVEPLSPEIVARLAAASMRVAPTLMVFDALLWGPEHLARYDLPAIRRAAGETALASMKQYAARYAEGGEHLPDFTFRRVSRARAAAAARALAANLAVLRDARVPLAYGTDAGNCMNPFGTTLFELEHDVGAGMTPLAALAAATSGSAAMLGLGDALGRIAPGYRADLIVIEGRPDEHLADIERVSRVIIDGIEQPLDEPSLGALILATLHVAWAWLSG